MDRILTHPILGDTPEGRLVNFTYDGQTLQGIEGEPIAAALRVAGVMTHRYTKKRHEPRGVFCAIGRCTDCVMVVNGKIHLTDHPVVQGMLLLRTAACAHEDLKRLDVKFVEPSYAEEELMWGSNGRELVLYADGYVKASFKVVK